MIRIAHIINPVLVGSESDLFIAQPVTFETMLIAQKLSEGVVDVNLATTQYEEDRKIIPDGFIKTKNLQRSVLDLGVFKKRRKLPVLNDILGRAAALNSDFIIYTNSDIALQPYFYLFVKQKIEEGLDAFVINRRTISGLHSLDTLYSAYSEIGEKHPGFDCFVFKRDLFYKLQLEDIIIGARYVGLSLYLNLSVFSSNFKEFDEEHLTFHIGNDQNWKKSEFDEYEAHNKKEYEKVEEKLSMYTENLQSVIDYALRFWSKENSEKKQEQIITSNLGLIDRIRSRFNLK
ncbi:hypothetical protein [Nonlabens xiamenensis]|uniref:hypothetical protein n=1 Tax=Nonlabens xiamenensis TaxID=2341043 RepID=UPI000F604E1C|nr:hypothetical protein [Nonlabens xiamenensis]